MLIQNQPESHLRSRRAFGVHTRTSFRFSTPTIVTSCAVWLNVVRLCLKGKRSFNTLKRNRIADLPRSEQAIIGAVHVARDSTRNRRSLVQVVPAHLPGARRGVRGARQRGRGWLKKLSAGIVLA